jgi:HD-GYP domain-containing protein (c-di-GMP phosphodiesterase class II)
VVIQLTRELNNSKGKPAAYIEGAYVISPAFIRKARYDAVLSALLAAGIVLITALILYPTIMRLLGKVSGLSAGLVHANLDILSVLGGALAKRDSETAIHTCRVTLYAIRIAQEVGLKDNEMRALIKGAFLHDVGKIGVKDSVLLKPGSLTSEEFEETKQHVRHGLDIVNRSIWLADAAPVVGGHHEKYDGSGYPEGRKGEEIPKIARIFAVADVFDALTSKRPYKETMRCESAIEIIFRDRASHFDPEILDVFLRIAPDLHKTYAEMAEETLRIEMKHLGARYFLSDLGGSFNESMSRNEIKLQ